MIRIDEGQLRGHLKELVRESAEQTLNAMLDAEADAQCGAKRYERTPERLDTRSGHYDRRLLTSAGEVTLQVPRLRKLRFETEIIERYRRRESSGEVRNIAVLVAVGVRSDGYREILGVAEGTKEDKERWRNFLRYLKGRGLKGVKLVISDKCLGLLEALGEFYPEAEWQRCMVHWYRNVFTVVPRGRRKEVAAMLKAIHGQEDRQAAREKAEAVAQKLEAMKLGPAAAIVREGVEETLSYMAFPREHWTRIRTNNMLERIMREIRRRTRVVGNFPDGQSAVMLVAARLRHVAGTRWGTRQYMDMARLREQEQEEQTAGVA